jgi:MFS family permease
MAGFARGILTLLQATAVTDRWGSTHYGHLSGVLSAPVTLTTAMGPWIGAALAGLLGGYAQMFLLLGALAAVATIVSLASTPSHLTGDPLRLTRPNRRPLNATGPSAAIQPGRCSVITCSLDPGFDDHQYDVCRSRGN